MHSISYYFFSDQIPFIYFKFQDLFDKCLISQKKTIFIMQPKIKKHFSLFMVSKSIRKPSKKRNDRTFEITIQGDNQANILEKCEVPRFLDSC